MEELFESILKNPFLILIILGGLFSLLKGKSSKNEQKEKQSANIPKPTVDPFNRGNPPSRKTPIEQQAKETISTFSMEEQRDEQIKRLAGQMDTDDHRALKDRPKVADATREIQIEDLERQYNKKFKTRFKRNLTRKGLIDSVVMAEVLGKPRAIKPYQSIISERKNK